jgi:hypothetical protein
MDENLKLKTDGGDGSSIVSSPFNTVTATTTINSTSITLIVEMKQVQETQAAAHTVHIAQLTALVKAKTTAPTPHLS